MSGGFKGRIPKVSLPAKMSELYQAYPVDSEGMVVNMNPDELVVNVPDIVFTRSSSLASTGKQD